MYLCYWFSFRRKIKSEEKIKMMFTKAENMNPTHTLHMTFFYVGFMGAHGKE